MFLLFKWLLDSIKEGKVGVILEEIRNKPYNFLFFILF